MASMARGSTIVRTLCRTSVKSTARRTSFSLGVPSRASNFTPRLNQNPIPSSWLFRRELSTFQPLHTAIASAYLVSNLPTEACTSTQGRFANYISPI